MEKSYGTLAATGIIDVIPYLRVWRQQENYMRTGESPCFVIDCPDDEMRRAGKRDRTKLILEMLETPKISIHIDSHGAENTATENDVSMRKSLNFCRSTPDRSLRLACFYAASRRH